MTKTIIFSIFLMWCIQSKANNVSHEHIVNENRSKSLSSETDSSNYKIKILETETSYSQITFTVVDESNNPLMGTISLNGGNGKIKSAVRTNDDGKIFFMVVDETIKHIVVARIGFGKVVIPIEKVKNKVTEVRVQLYPFGTTN